MATKIPRLARSALMSQLLRGTSRACRWQKLLANQRSIHSSRTLASNNEIHLTATCVKQLKKILEGDEFLRIIIEGGGCSGFQYKFEIDSSLQEDDKLFEEDGGKVVVDIDSLELIKGSAIDYQIEMIKAGFVVLKNPNVEKGCSCGSSFSIKI